MDAAIIILGVTIALAVVVKLLQRKFIDQKKVKGLQKQLKEDNKKYMALLKEGEKNKKEIDELQSRIMKGNMEVMNSSMKLNFVILPVFLVALWGLGFLFGKEIIQSLIPLPTFHNFTLWNPTTWVPIGVGMTSGYYKAYFFYYIISTITVTIVERIYDMVKHPKEKVENGKKEEAKVEAKAEEKKEEITQNNVATGGEVKLQ